MEKPDWKETLRQLAVREGFAICRVAAACKPPHTNYFQKWLSDGNHAGMDWMERTAQRRVDPNLVLPGIRSVVVLAMNYYQGEAPPTSTEGACGTVARYAWGDDYHEMMESRLRVLATQMEQWGGKQKCYVDTGPVLERDFAALSGLGWHGKSTMLLNRKLGTWFFLAEILTTLDFPPDETEKDHCGKCTRCIEACPTGAIFAPYQLDARKCISYLTIENKGPIPLEFRKAIGDRIYGCDDCLDACPWNRFAAISHEATFQAREGTSGLLLRDFLSLDDVGFRQIFRGSPIKRIKRPRFLRNVCVALGNVGSPEDLPALDHAATDPDPLVAEHATWAAAQIRSRDSDLQ